MKKNNMWIKPEGWITATKQELEQVANLIGKEPNGEFRVVAKDDSGHIIVIENAPFFFDGTPMPTRYWLVDPSICRDVSKVESIGGVRKAEKEVDPDIIEKIHLRYAKQRDELISPEYEGPCPTGGVGGTRRGLKCLHTHVAHYIATNNDVVGEWTINEIERMRKEGSL